MWIKIKHFNLSRSESVCSEDIYTTLIYNSKNFEHFIEKYCIKTVSETPFFNKIFNK